MRSIGKILCGAALICALPIVAFGLNAESNKKGKKAEQIKLIGEPERCIRPNNISSTRVIDNKTIEFRMFGSKFYRSNLDHACPGLSRNDPIKYNIRGSQLCSVDIFTVLDVNAGRIDTRASCGFGKFQEIEKVKATAKDR